MPQHDSVSRAGDPERRYVPDFPTLCIPASLADTLSAAQIAALHRERAQELHAEAARIHRKLIEYTREMARLTPQWFSVRAPMVEPGAPVPSDAEMDRFAMLDARVSELDGAYLAGREHWRELEADAQGHELAAVYYGPPDTSA